MQFVDAALMDAAPRKLRDGSLVATARSVRTGVQLYAGSEVGKPDKDIVRVYRSPEEVFAQDSLQSFSHATVTVDHPTKHVTADNWKELAVGEVSTAAKKDGEWVHLPLVIKDRAAVEAVEGGKCELSAGYVCDLDWTGGTTPGGEVFDAQQRNIRINHLAIVDRARAGSKARIGDALPNWGASPIRDGASGAPVDQADAGHKPGEPDVQLKTILVDGLTVETTDAGALAIDKLRGLLDTSAKALEKATTDHAAAIAAKDAELAAKDAEIDAAKAKIIDGDALDALVAERAAVTSKAKALDANVVIDGKSNIEIKRAVLGDKATGKPDAYVDAAFDLIAVDGQAQGDALASFVSDAAGAEVKDAATKARDARAARLARLQNGYQAADQAA